jgi:signal transduction histidine kinase
MAMLCAAGLAAAAAVVAMLALRLRRASRSRPDASQPRGRGDARPAGRGEAELPPRVRDPEWIAVLGHELRTPLGAVLGYGELLEDGAFGALQPEALDAVRRLRAAADHLLALVEGLDEPSATSAPRVAHVAAATLLAEAADRLRADAEARGVSIRLHEAHGVAFTTDREGAARALVLALGAAVKASPGAALDVFAHSGAPPYLAIRGARIDPQGDGFSDSGPLTGTGLRLELARRAARSIGGDVVAETAAGDVVIRLTLPPLSPPLSIDGAEQTP